MGLEGYIEWIQCCSRHIEIQAPCSAANTFAPNFLASTSWRTCARITSRIGEAVPREVSSLQCMMQTRKPSRAPFKSSDVIELRFCLLRIGLLRESLVDFWRLYATTSCARTDNSATRCSGVRCPKRILSGRPEG